MAGNDQDAHFVGILGATGCGKTTEFKRQLAKVPAKQKRRTLFWSPKERKDNYAALFKGSVICRTASEVLAVVRKAGRRGEFHIVFVPTLDKKRDMALFDVVCKIVLEAENMVMIVDELHSVTEPSRAVHGWQLVNFIGRASGVWVFGMSQRPASVDKAFMGSLSFVHVGRLPHPPDQDTAARILGVTSAEVAALVGYQAIQRNNLTGEVKRPT